MNALGLLFVGLVGFHVAHALIESRKRRAQDVAPPFTHFILSVAPFVVVCASGVKRMRDRLLIAPYLQVLLFMLACAFGFQRGVFSRALISPVNIGVGLLAGHLIFGASLLITQRSLRDAAIHFVDFGSLWRFAVDSPTVLLQFISVAVAEEMIYRVGAQPLLSAWTGSALVGVLVVAVAFSFVHEHFFQNSASQSAEFFGFAILLGALYSWTDSLILVIVVHALRNIEIAFLEYLVRVEECGSEAAAVRETEFLTGERLLVLLILPVRDLAVACLEYSGWTGQWPSALPRPTTAGTECP